MTGASTRWVPRARASSAATLMTCSTSDGSQALARPMGMGKDVPRGAVSPCSASSCVRAGILSRVFSTSHFWTAFTKAAFSRGPSTIFFGWSRSSLGRASWPMPFLSRAPALAGSKRPSSSVIWSLAFQMPRVCATFSSSVMRASSSATRASTGDAAGGGDVPRPQAAVSSEMPRSQRFMSSSRRGWSLIPT
jgi:hypothetical protein